MASLKVWLLASRPKTLVFILSPVLVGTALAFYEGVFTLGTFIVTLCTGLLVQILTNFANDFFDFKKGADTNKRVGPTRVMQKGLMSEKAMIRGMILCILSIVLGGIYLISVGGWMIGALTLLAILLAFGYTAGPFPLAYLGLGDLFVIAFFGVAATSCSFFLQTGYVSSASLFMGLLMGFLCNAPLVINNLRDEEEDRKVAKKTLIVRMGQESGKSFLFLCALIPAAGTPLVAYLLGKTFLSLAALPLLFLFPYHLSTCKKPHDFLPLLPRFSLMIALYTFLFIIALLFS